MNRNVFLVDCNVNEVESIAHEIDCFGGPFVICQHIANWKRDGIKSELRRYATYFGVGLKYFLDRKSIDVVVGWQQFYALFFSFFSSLFHVKKTTTVIALNYTYKEKKGLLRWPYYSFMKKCINEVYMDYLHVLSDEYADQIAGEFGFPRERIIVTPFGVDDPFEAFSKLKVPDGYESNGYALAIGRSNRDYDFLIDAWNMIEYPLVVISDTYRGTTSNKNIRIISNVSGIDAHPWIAHCGMMVIPIDDGSICSGDTVLLTAMAAKRRIIVTVPSTLAEMYIQNGINAVLTPKKITEFQKIVQELLNECDGVLGNRARESFLNNYSRRAMGRRINVWLQNRGELSENPTLT